MRDPAVKGRSPRRGRPLRGFGGIREGSLEERREGGAGRRGGRCTDLIAPLPHSAGKSTVWGTMRWEDQPNFHETLLPDCQYKKVNPASEIVSTYD